MGIGVSVAVAIGIESTSASVGGTLSTAGAVTVKADSTVEAKTEAKGSAKGAKGGDEDQPGGKEEKTADQQSAGSTDNGASRTQSGSRARSTSAPSANSNIAGGNSSASGADSKDDTTGGSNGQASSIKVAAAIGVAYLKTDASALIVDGASVTSTAGQVQVLSTSETDSTVKSIGLDRKSVV